MNGWNISRARGTARIALAALLALTLTGCAATWQTPLTCAAIGGGLGAIGGGVGGAEHADSHDDWEGVAIAAGSTIAGAGIGYMICKLVEDDPKPAPRRAAAADPAPVVVAAPIVPPPADPCEELVRLDGVTFASDKADIGSQSANVLDGTIKALSSCERKRVRVEAYTDSSGAEDYNQALSQRRADSVRQYLIDNGIAAERIEALGRGEADPISSNDTPEGRARNRRVELEPTD